jgi:hypothetical protein
MPFLYNYGPSAYFRYSNSGPTTSNLFQWIDASNPSSYNGSGNIWYDLSGNSNNMTLSNYYFTGGNSFYFNGTNTATISPNMISFLNSSSFNQTQEIWFKNYVSGTYTNGVVIDELGQSTPNIGWHDSQFEIVNGIGYIRVWNNSSLNVGTFQTNVWRQLVWRYNATSGTLDGFVNGVKVVTSGNGLYRINTNPGYYSALGQSDGTNLGNGGYFKGFIGLYRNYNKALSDSEILQNYNADKYKFS